MTAPTKFHRVANQMIGFMEFPKTNCSISGNIFLGIFVNTC